MSVTPRDRNGVCVACGSCRDEDHRPSCVFAERVTPVGHCALCERDLRVALHAPSCPFVSDKVLELGAPSPELAKWMEDNPIHHEHVHVAYAPTVGGLDPEVEAGRKPPPRDPSQDSIGLFQQPTTAWAEWMAADNERAPWDPLLTTELWEAANPAYRRPTDAYTIDGLTRARDRIAALSATVHQLAAPEGAGYQPEENNMTNYRDARGKAQAALRDAEEDYNRAAEKSRKASDKLVRARTRVAEARENLKRAGWPEEPTPYYTHLNPGVDDPMVIRGYCPPVTVTFSRRLHGRRYSYAAVGVRNELQNRCHWYLTGNKDHRGEAMSWTELLEFAGDYGRATLCVSQAAKYIGVSSL